MHIGNSQYSVVVSHTLVHVACLPQTRIPCISGTLSTLLLYPTHWYLSHVYHKLEYRAYRELSVLCCCIPHTGTCRMFKSGTLSTLLLYPTHWYLSHVYHKLMKHSLSYSCVTEMWRVGTTSPTSTSTAGPCRPTATTPRRSRPVQVEVATTPTS